MAEMKKHMKKDCRVCRGAISDAPSKAGNICRMCWKAALRARYAMRRSNDPDFVKRKKAYGSINYSRMNREQRRAYHAAYALGLKRAALAHYGSTCQCCGEDTIEFLTLDHVNNDGAAHRKLVHGGFELYLWLRKHKYPAEPQLQVLCMNCNVAKGWRGQCPHQRRVLGLVGA
jgi:hypothetical protein